MKPRCVDCTEWQSRDGLSGHCQAAPVDVVGAWVLTTGHDAACPMFNPLQDAVRVRAVEREHWRFMRRETEGRAW